jgi:hypothetical protein
LIRKRTAALIAAAALAVALVPAASTAGAAPSATKSGTLVNFVSTGKLKIQKKITIYLLCSANCQVDATIVIIAPGPNFTAHVSGPLQAGVQGGPFFQPNGPLLKAMKAAPGKFKIGATITATDATTGAVETISNTFKLKR